MEAGPWSVSPPFSIMKFTIEKLDRRHNGYLFWHGRLRIQNNLQEAKSQYKNFHILRSWMIEQYGVSSERDTYTDILMACKGSELFDPLWCWHVDGDYPNNQYIYVRNQEVLSHITLRWI